MNNHEIYCYFWVRFEALATLSFFEDITKGDTKIDKKGKANQLIRRNRCVVQYSEAEFEPYIRIYV